MNTMHEPLQTIYNGAMLNYISKQTKKKEYASRIVVEKFPIITFKSLNDVFFDRPQAWKLFKE